MSNRTANAIQTRTFLVVERHIQYGQKQRSPGWDPGSTFLSVLFALSSRGKLTRTLLSLQPVFDFLLEDRRIVPTSRCSGLWFCPPGPVRYVRRHISH